MSTARHPKRFLLVAMLIAAFSCGVCAEEAPTPEEAPPENPLAWVTALRGPGKILPEGQHYTEPGFGVKLPTKRNDEGEEVVDEELVERIHGLIDELLVSKRRRAARDELIAMGNVVPPVLMTRRDDANFTIRWEVVNIGGYIAYSPQAVSICENVMTDENPHVRWRGMWALSEFSNKRDIVNVFREGLKSTDDFVHWNAAIGLTMSGSKDSLDIIHEGLNQQDDWRRWEAINALSRVHNAESTAHLEQVFTDPVFVLRDRQEAALALGKIGDATGLRILCERAVADPHHQVRWRACMSIKRLRAKSACKALAKLKKTETNADVLKHLNQAWAACGCTADDLRAAEAEEEGK